MSLLQADLLSACIMLLLCSGALFFAAHDSQKQDEEIARLKANQRPLD